MNTKTYGKINKRLTKGQTAALFCVCLVMPALLGWLGSFLSGMMADTGTRAPYTPNGMISTIIWTFCCALLGIGLFLAITADTRNDNTRTVKLLSVSLWGALFVLSLVWPFLMYSARAFMLSFVWLVIIDAIAVALTTVNFRLRPASAFAVMPYAIFTVLMTYAAFYLALYI